MLKTSLYRIFPIVLLIFFAAGCFPFDVLLTSDDDDDSYPAWWWYSSSTPNYDYNPDGDTVITLTDNFNGTVQVLKKYGTSTVMDTVVKKCLQGQEYRPAENDCQALGTSETNFGAALLQYCDADNNSCNDYYHYLSNLGNSTAYNSCDMDISIGVPLRVVYGSVLETILSHPDLYTVFPELGADYIWSNIAYSDTDGRVHKFGNTVTHYPKTSSYFVLCEQVLAP